jgi:hypothetical protein
MSIDRTARDGKLGPGLESGCWEKDKIEDGADKVSNKPLPAMGTPPWPKAKIRSAGDGQKWRN